MDCGRKTHGTAFVKTEKIHRVVVACWVQAVPLTSCVSWTNLICKICFTYPQNEANNYTSLLESLWGLSSVNVMKSASGSTWGRVCMDYWLVFHFQENDTKSTRFFPLTEVYQKCVHFLWTSCLIPNFQGLLFVSFLVFKQSWPKPHTIKSLHSLAHSYNSTTKGSPPLDSRGLSKLSVEGWRVHN